MIDTLNEAHDQVKGLFNSGKYETVLTLLSDVHEFADRIIDLVYEGKAGETQTAADLERLMGVIKAAFEEIDRCIEEKAKPGDGFIKAWHRLNMKLETGAKSELKPDRLEVVFLPYKASMWDSFESVWLAAKDDPDCDTYVVPIPYNDKNPDGTFGKEHYEINDYPDYVPVTNWREYDMEARQPDVIFIHNPYDGINTVTQVPPCFFSDKLKDVTDMLVYIPYFVGIGVVPEDFCLVPGALNADKIFVESEIQRHQYIKKIAEYNGASGSDLENKFAALGSPKFDKVINSKPEDFKLTEEWARLLENPSAGRKKTVLYNVHLFMNTSVGPDRQLDKLEYALGVFKERADAVLWLRPHPLNLNFLRKREPKLLARYTAIVEAFKAAGWGIYDDTADLHRALTMSDAYYGDYSSLVLLESAAGRPVLIQNFNLLGREDGLAGFRPKIIHDTGDAYWFTDWTVNGLFKVDKESGEVEYMCGFQGFGSKGLDVYSFIISSVGKIYLAPNSAEVIGVYDTRTGTFGSIPLPTPGQETQSAKVPKFTEAILKNDILYFIPGSYPGILAYDTVTGKLEVIDGWLDRVNALGISERRPMFAAGAVDRERNCLALVCSGVNALLELDLTTGKSRLQRVGNNGDAFNGIVIINGTYWLSLEKRAEKSAGVASYNPSTGEFNSYTAGTTDIPFEQVLKLEDSGYIALLSGAAALKFDTVSKEFVPLNEPDIKYNRYHIMPKTSESHIFLREKSTGRVLDIEPLSGVKREIEITPRHVKNPQKLRDDIFRWDAGQIEKLFGCVLTENTCGVRLDDMIDGLTQADGPNWLTKLKERQAQLYSVSIKNLDGSAGAAIYKMCKDESLNG